jgi:hypothetical protein
MAGDLRRRLAKLRARQPKPRDDHWFEPWGEGAREAWADVSPEQKEDLWAQYLRAGPFAGPCMVRRGPDGAWGLSIFNTKFGGIEYAIMSAVREIGVEAFLSWAEAECTPVELETLGRAFAGNWNPKYLHDGDVNVLSGVTPRLPRAHR